MITFRTFKIFVGEWYYLLNIFILITSCKQLFVYKNHRSIISSKVLYVLLTWNFTPISLWCCCKVTPTFLQSYLPFREKYIFINCWLNSSKVKFGSKFIRFVGFLWINLIRESNFSILWKTTRIPSYELIGYEIWLWSSNMGKRKIENQMKNVNEPKEGD